MSELTETEERRERKLGVVKGLLDKANNNPFGEEAASCRAKAEQLMMAYRISEAEIAAKAGAVRTEPVLRHITVVREEGNQVKAYFIDLFSMLSMFAHTRCVYNGMQGNGQCTARVVGFPEDIEYLDMLYTSVSLQFSQELNPHYDANLGRAENVYRMKAAGLNWKEIFNRLDLPFADMYGKPTPERSSVYNEYQRFCKGTGLKPISANPKTWVRNFADGFVSTIQSRIVEILSQQSVAKMNEDEKQGKLYDIVLRDRDKQVDDAYRQHFPYVRYRSAHKGGGTKFLGDAAAQGSLAGQKADIGTGGSIRNTRKELGS